jgi:hypothetical protein
MSLIKKAHIWPPTKLKGFYPKFMKAREKNTSSPRSQEEFRFLKRIGQRIHKRLSDINKPVEWLAWESETSRATIRRIFDADRNVGILTLDRIARALNYKDGIAGLLDDL